MVDSYHIALSQMMENAGRDLAEMARRTLHGQVREHPITILCGPGNNGGGGMVAARHLHNWGAHVNVVLAAKSAGLREVSARQWSILEALHLDQIQFELEYLGPPSGCVAWLRRHGRSPPPNPPMDRTRQCLRPCQPISGFTVRIGYDNRKSRPTLHPGRGHDDAGSSQNGIAGGWRPRVCRRIVSGGHRCAPRTLRRAVARPVCRADV